MQNILFGIIAGLVLISIFNTPNKKKSDKTSEPLINILETNASAELDNITYSSTNLGWIENSRNNRNFKKYPPCFNLSIEAQKLFDILESYDMVVKHKVLLEVYSIILCQVSYLKSKLCPQTMLIDRLTDLDALGALRYTKYYNELINYVSKSILGLTSPISLEFLNKSLFLIDKEIDKIILPKDKIDDIKQFNKSICSYAFPIIARDC